MNRKYLMFPAAFALSLAAVACEAPEDEPVEQPGGGGDRNDDPPMEEY